MKKIAWYPIKMIALLNICTVFGCVETADVRARRSQWLGSQEIIPVSDRGRWIANNNYTIDLLAVKGSELRMSSETNELYTVTNGCFLAFSPDLGNVDGIWPPAAERIYLLARISAIAGKETCGVIQVKVKVTDGVLKGCFVTVKPGALFGGPEAMFDYMYGDQKHVRSIYLIPEEFNIAPGRIPFKLVAFNYK